MAGSLILQSIASKTALCTKCCHVEILKYQCFRLVGFGSCRCFSSRGQKSVLIALFCAIYVFRSKKCCDNCVFVYRAKEGLQKNTIVSYIADCWIHPGEELDRKRSVTFWQGNLVCLCFARCRQVLLRSGVNNKLFFNVSRLQYFSPSDVQSDWRSSFFSQIMARHSPQQSFGIGPDPWNWRGKSDVKTPTSKNSRNLWYDRHLCGLNLILVWSIRGLDSRMDQGMDTGIYLLLSVLRKESSSTIRSFLFEQIHSVVPIHVDTAEVCGFVRMTNCCYIRRHEDQQSTYHAHPHPHRPHPHPHRRRHRRHHRHTSVKVQLRWSEAFQ